MRFETLTRRLKLRRRSEFKTLRLPPATHQTDIYFPFRTPTNVLPLVNKALAVFQWKQDMATAEALCKEALEIDEECDVAVATAAQLSLQQGKIPEAIKWFEQSAKLARTEQELTAAITCKIGLRMGVR
jgi:tetratricopeptide (TPR) repeat protein